MLIYQNKLPIDNRDAVIAKINSVSNNLGINPNWLMAVMDFESNINPAAINPYSGATGLIQFMPSTAIGLGTTVEQLRFMPMVVQLDYVEDYYRMWKSNISSFVDLYLATFFPLAMGKPDDWVLQTSNISAEIIAQQNPGFDLLKNGQVTVGNIKKVILAKMPKDYLQYVTTTKTGVGLGFVGLVIFGFILYKNLN